MKNNDKPIQIAMEEIKTKIVNLINEECNKNGVDYYFLSMILKDIFEEIISLKDKELDELKKQYNESIKEEDK